MASATRAFVAFAEKDTVGFFRDLTTVLFTLPMELLAKFIDINARQLFQKTAPYGRQSLRQYSLPQSRGPSNGETTCPKLSQPP